MTASALANHEAPPCADKTLLRETVQALDTIGLRQSVSRP
jgi:hypothetical protein